MARQTFSIISIPKISNSTILIIFQLKNMTIFQSVKREEVIKGGHKDEKWIFLPKSYFCLDLWKKILFLKTKYFWQNLCLWLFQVKITTFGQFLTAKFQVINGFWENVRNTWMNGQEWNQGSYELTFIWRTNIQTTKAKKKQK